LSLGRIPVAALSGAAYGGAVSSSEPLVLRAAFIESKLRLLVGAGVLGIAAIDLAGAGSTLWSAVLLGLLAPWLVLGRDARRLRRGVRDGLRLAPNGGRWVLAELAPPLSLVAVGALLGAGGKPAPAVCLFCWGAWLVTLADAFDRRSARAGAAWLAVLIPALALLTMPLWLAGLFGQSDWAPWPATLSVGLHPAGMALAGAGKAALQDPIFYRWTLSGVVEAHPLSWLYGAAFYMALAALAVGAAMRAARRPVQAFAHRAGR
jgi:hypothetical protein